MRAQSLTIFVSAILFLQVGSLYAGTPRSKATSRDGDFSVQIESEGRTLPVYRHNGKSYIEGTYGDTYGIRVINHTGDRIEAVVTVDGRDVVSGQIGNYKKERGYVIAPYDSVLIEGFRRSWNNVAQFTFTDIQDSYAARMGDAGNVGVIGVAIFKEKARRPKPTPVHPYAHDDYRSESEQNFGSGYGSGSAPKRQRYRSAPSSSRANGSKSGAYSSDEDAERLGTAYGDDAYSPTVQTTFVRSRRRPDAILSIRYDDRDGLHRLGVLPVYRHTPRTQPNPFPGSPEPVRFAPPPPPKRWWEYR